MVMPNTKVKFKAVIYGGIVVIQSFRSQWLYIDLQFGISKLNAIYGSFAAPTFIPLASGQLDHSSWR
jgi:hypothetical protein